MGAHKGATEKKTRIKEQASRLFLTKGFSEVTLQSVAEAAGIGKASIYHYFPGGKDELFRIIVREAAEGYFRELRKEAMTGQSAAEKIQQYLTASVRRFWAGVPTADNELERRAFIAQCSADTGDMRSIERGFLMGLLDEGKIKGEFRDFDSNIVAEFLRVLTYALTVENFYVGEEAPTSSDLEHLVDFAMHGLIQEK